jgi:hypothetical protein
LLLQQALHFVGGETALRTRLQERVQDRLLSSQLAQCGQTISPFLGGIVGEEVHARPPLDEAALKTALLDLAAEWPTYGYRRLTALMKRLGWPVNGKRVRRWMDELDLCGAPPEKRCRTTDSRHGWPRYENLVKGLAVVRPEQVWVAP